MKFRIVQIDEGKYIVQRKMYFLWVFYFWITEEEGPSFTRDEKVFESVEEAEAYIKEHSQPYFKKKVIKTI